MKAGKKKKGQNNGNNRDFSDLTIIIPTLNEEENVKIITKKIFTTYRNINLIVVDDNSTDRTIQNVRELTKEYPNLRLVVKKGKKKGLTGSLIEGAKYSKTKFLVFMDADLQHPVEKVSEIYKKLKLKNCDLVVGVRKDDSGLGDLKRRIISRTARFLMASKLLVFNIHCKDPVSGFFGVKRELILYAIKRFGYVFEYNGYKILSDLFNAIIKSGRNITICNVKYDFMRRTHGRSKLSNKQIISFLRTLFK